MDINALLNYFEISSWQESENLEWKLSTRESKEIVQTIAAFANTRGGVLMCGVKDGGEIVGQDISDATLREISQTILANTHERLYPSIERIVVDGKAVLSVQINESPLKPHLAYGRPYKRVGPSNVSLDQSEYYLMLGQKQNGGGADRDVIEGVSLEALDQEQIKRFVAAANEKRNLNLPVFADIMQILDSLELTAAGRLTKGALLLFGRNPQQLIPQAEVRAAHFKDEKRDIFLTQRILTGNLFSQFNAIMEFAKDRLALHVDASGSGDRTSRAIPVGVIQELAANALVHRDYRDPAATYFNIIGDSELEISNPGLLPAPRITPETIHLLHPSIPVNRRIARVFFLAGIIEQWGEGTRRVWREITARGLPPPIWESTRGTVRVALRLGTT